MAARWGSLLSQAVAGVESRLDNMLAEGEENGGAGIATKPAGAQASARASSRTRANDRLQARLAKAMASKNAGSPSPRASSDLDVTGRGSTEGLRTSLDHEIKADSEAKPEAKPEAKSKAEQPAPTTALPDSTDDQNITSDAKEDDQGDQGDKAPQAEHATEEVADDDDGKRELQEAKEANERHQREIQEYVERIDSLQSKLQYMSRNVAESAKKAASSAAPGSTERKLAEKDERIALLMEEGQKLSGAEQQYRATIKKMRLQLSEKEKQLVDAGNEKVKAVSEAEALRSRLSGDEEKEKRHQKAIKATAALQRELDGLKRDKANKDETIRRLEQDAKAKLEEAAVTHADALKRALAVELEKQKELESKHASLAADLEAARDKTARDHVEWGERLQRAVERGRAVEAELRAELKAMDGKLESMRAAAEEASSGSGGEAQGKLLRQIETLQTQYTSARENWQGIEASLLTRAGGLESERDEAQRRESDMRKRARDAAGRCRALEEEVQDTQSALAAAQRELEECREECREELAALRSSSRASEAAMEQLRAEVKKANHRSATANANREQLSPEAEGRQWADTVRSRPVSPLPAVPRTMSADILGFPPVSGRSNPVSSPPPPSLSLASPSTWATRENRENRENGIPDTAPSSPRNLAQDMVSVCTVAAGPSVQLVERMSAAIRRLEGEKVTAKEEMARVCAQRDEARGEIAALMKEVEEARAAAETVPDLQQQVKDLDARYQTTLELLGEKSELVEELRADVDDVKAMYRELVERAVK